MEDWRPKILVQECWKPHTLALVERPLRLEAYCDGSFEGLYPQFAPAGAGVVLKSPEGGTLVSKFAGFMAEGALDAEWYAACLALEMLVERRPDYSILFSDCTKVVQLLGVQEKQDRYRRSYKRYGSLFERMLEYSRELPNLKVAWIPREANTEADRLARMAREEIAVPEENRETREDHLAVRQRLSLLPRKRILDRD